MLRGPAEAGWNPPPLTEYGCQSASVEKSCFSPTAVFEMVPTQVTGEMVLDRGGHFIPGGIFGVHALSLLLLSLVAHDRTKEDARTHTGKEHKYIIINVGTVHKPRQGGINSVPL